MKLNSPELIQTAEEVFREYRGSWTAARDAGKRDVDGVLVIPRKAPSGDDHRLNGGGRTHPKSL